MKALYWIEIIPDVADDDATLSERVDNFRESVQPSAEHGLLIYLAECGRCGSKPGNPDQTCPECSPDEPKWGPLPVREVDGKVSA